MLTAHGVTHVGHVRKTNEDHLLVDLDLGLFLVADGMGGHIAGEVASRMAVETIRTFIARSQHGGNCTWPFGIDPDASFAVNRLNTAVKLANRRVFRASESVDDYTGMGTTIVAALVEGDPVAFAGVGDSRLYVCTHDSVTQLTSDDSWVATVLARDPEVDETSLAAHPPCGTCSPTLLALAMRLTSRSVSGRGGRARRSCYVATGSMARSMTRPSLVCPLATARLTPVRSACSMPHWRWEERTTSPRWC